MVEAWDMRIGKLAAIADTTTRTVRHYHRLGLLEEPRRLPNGYREYTVDDAVRLMRIRWLAARGVPLGSVAAILAEDKPDEDIRDIVADLRELVRDVEHEQAELARRREQLAAMLAEAERGQGISALPSRLSAALSETIDNSRTAGSALRRDRDLVEALVMSGKAPENLLGVYEETVTDPDRRERYLMALADWSDLEGRSPETAQPQIAAVADRILGLFEHQQALLPQAERACGEPNEALTLDDMISDPAQGAVVRLVRRGLLARSSTPTDIE